MPRYVILEHDHPQRHWDLMLENGNSLRTWRLHDLPRADHPVAATASFDHRLLYLTYEGPISGGRGSVQRWDEGIFTLQQEIDQRLVLHLDGQRLRGRAVLERSAAEDWTFRLS